MQHAVERVHSPSYSLHSPSHNVHSPKRSRDGSGRWMYPTLIVISVSQIILVAGLQSVLRGIPWNENPIISGPRTWIFESLYLSFKYMGVFFFLLTSGLGFWVGFAWLKYRNYTALFEEQVTRIRRAVVFIAAYDVLAALFALLCAIHQPLFPTLAGIWLLCKFALCHRIILVTRNTAYKQDKPPAPGDAEFSVHCSLLLIGSVVQVVASLLGLWNLSVGIVQEHAREGIAVFISVVSLLTAVASGILGADPSVRYLGSSSEGLIGRGLRPAFAINAINLVLAGFVAGFGWWAQQDDSNIVRIVACMTSIACMMFMLLRMHYLVLLASINDMHDRQCNAVMAYVHHAESAMIV